MPHPLLDEGARHDLAAGQDCPPGKARWDVRREEAGSLGDSPTRRIRARGELERRAVARLAGIMRGRRRTGEARESGMASSDPQGQWPSIEGAEEEREKPRRAAPPAA